MVGPVTKSALQQLAEERLLDAQALLAAQRFAGCYYLAGYSVECGLKALIAARFRADEIPDPKFVRDVYSHDLQKLAEWAGLLEIFRARQNAKLVANRGVVSQWTPASRYELKPLQDAEDMVRAVADPAEGVLTCIQMFW